jgi:PAS domain S-box-containing protein
MCEFVARKLQDGYALSFHDVTDHRSTETAARPSEEILQKALRSSSDSIAISRLSDGRFVEVNEGFQRISGYGRDEAVGRTSLELGLWKNPDHRARLVEILEHDGRVRDFEADFATSAGEVRSCLVSAEILELDGEWCMITTVRDITDNRRTEEALHWFNERLQQERQNLVEKEVALKQIIDYLDEEKSAFRSELNSHVEELLSPVIAKLRNQGGHLTQSDVELLENNLRRIVDVQVDDVKDSFSKLTLREIDICEAIKEGLSSKEIAERFELSVNTVHKHRQVIRRKLQLKNKEINLAAFLRSR